MLGAYYQVYKQHHCVDYVLSKYRRFYTNTDVVLISDGGDDYTHIAQKYKCNYTYEKNLSGEKSNKQHGLSGLYFHTPQILIDYVTRFKTHISKIRQKYFILLEDDVVVLNHTDVSTFNKQIYGKNIRESLPQPICKYLNADIIPYGGCGGNIFDKEFFVNALNTKDYTSDINHYCHLTKEKWASDSILSYLCILYGGKLVEWSRFGNMWEKDIKTKLENNDIDILHDFKELYNKQGTTI